MKDIKENKQNNTNSVPLHGLGVLGIDENGYYGEFGGAYIPEILHGTVERLTIAYNAIKEDASFKAEYYDLLKNYVGRPSPLYFANFSFISIFSIVSFISEFIWSLCNCKRYFQTASPKTV